MSSPPAGTNSNAGEYALLQLRRNERKRADKMGGRKRPRAADVDVVATPDAGLGAALLGHGVLDN